MDIIEGMYNDAPFEQLNSGKTIGLQGGMLFLNLLKSGNKHLITKEEFKEFAERFLV